MSDPKENWVAWAEIPAPNFSRSRSFYETIFDTSIEVADFGNFKMGIFPHKSVGIALCSHEAYQPKDNGPLIYIDANPDLDLVLNRVEKAGGKILRPKSMISPDHGFMALFLDSEGNRLALHSNK